MNSMVNYRNSFLHSAQAQTNRFQNLAATRSWLQDLRAHPGCSVERIPLAELEQWSFAEGSGNLQHRSGKFFSIAGLHCTPAAAPGQAWEQPIILQPEVGILGILTREFDGTRYFLMQAKMEPGNPHLIQLSPTLQATFSNYSQAHRGNLPPYTQYFLDPSARVINSQLQSETGSRFFRKFNRNVLLDLEEEVDILPGFRWLTLFEIQRLLREDDLVNMDSRSVLSNVSCAGARAGTGATVFLESATSPVAHHPLPELRAWLRAQRAKLAIATRPLGLNEVHGWVRDAHGVRHATENYFEVAGVRVEGGGREVASWCQPLLKHEGLGLSGFLCAEIGGVLHFLIQAKPEPGLVDSVELAPTVAIFDYRPRAARGLHVPYLEHFLEPAAGSVLYSSIQSEEGGRFWGLRNHVLVVQVPDAGALRREENFAWMTLAQLRQLAQGESVVNSEARTLLACLPLFE